MEFVRHCICTGFINIDFEFINVEEIGKQRAD